MIEVREPLQKLDRIYKYLKPEMSNSVPFLKVGNDGRFTNPHNAHVNPADQAANLIGWAMNKVVVDAVRGKGSI
jgi:hypothetical protein